MIDFSAIFGGTSTGGIGGTGVTGGDLLSLGSAAGSIAGGFMAASGAEQAGKAQSQADLANAAIQGQNAAQAERATATNRLQSDYLFNRYLGKVGAAYGAAGVGGLSASPLDVMADAEQQHLIEVANRKGEGDFAARSAGEQAAFDVQAAAAARKAAKTSASSDILGGITAGIGTVAKMFLL